MIWLTWRQFRTQAIVALSVLVALGVILLITGISIEHIYNTSQVPDCHAHHDCQQAAQNYITGLRNNPLYFLLYYIGIVLVYLTPAIAGVFWGAPLITREWETGTFRLAWNQSVTRSRWLAAKVGLVGLAAMVTAGLLSWMVSWWASPIERVSGLGQGTGAINRLAPVLFGAGGITPIGYAAFGFALGVTAGVLFRRTVPAMAVTLAVFAAIQIVMPVVIRPHLISPVQSTSALNVNNIQGLEVGGGNGSQMTVVSSVNEPSAWVLGNQTITSSGTVFTGPATSACMNNKIPFSQCQASIAQLHLRTLVTYQPASRYWEFQWYETASFVALALLLAGFCFWWIGRRRIA